ncbi:MAG: protein kinase domain-containing protein [Nodosilinea sp.]
MSHFPKAVQGTAIAIEAQKLPVLCFNPGCGQPVNLPEALVCQTCGGAIALQDRYRCQKILGQGYWGRTYLGLDGHTTPLRRCVIKQMIPRDGGQGDFHHSSDWFQALAQSLSTLGHHPQIPELLAVVDNDQGQFLIQEYIPGPNLEQLTPTEPFTEAKIRCLLGEILPVLEFVHAHQIIHRDIKPASIICPPPPQPLALVDFGALKSIDDQAWLEQGGTAMGSAGYAAPEQVLGKAVFASDIFSLGVTCLYLLTGLHPFDLYSVSDDSWVWQPFLLRPVSPVLARILDRMVNRSLQKRYRQAREVLVDLRWAGTGSPSNCQASSSPSSTWRRDLRVELTGKRVNALAISPNGRAIATACGDAFLYLWDSINGEPIHRFGKVMGRWGLGHQGQVTTLAFTPDGRALISGGEDGQLIFWDLVDYGQSQPLPLRIWSVTRLLVAPDGKTLVVGSGDGQIDLCSLEPGDQGFFLRQLVNHQDRITALALRCNGEILVSGSRDRTLRLWALPTGQLLQTLRAPLAPITALACDPQDHSILSGDARGGLQIWSPGSSIDGHLVEKLAGSITALALSPNRQWLAVGWEQGGLRLFKLPWQDQAIPLPAWNVEGLAFSPDSQTLVVSSGDQTLQFWRLDSPIASCGDGHF